MKQFIVINAETASKCWVWSRGSPGTPSPFDAVRPLPPFIILWGRVLGDRASSEGLRCVVFDHFSAGLFWQIRRVSCLISFRIFCRGFSCFLRMKEEGQTHGIIAILATAILISAHESGRLHTQVHRVMGRAGLWLLSLMISCSNQRCS